MVRFSTYIIFMSVLTVILYFMGLPTIATVLSSSPSWGQPVHETCNSYFDVAANKTVTDPLCTHASTQTSNNSSSTIIGAILVLLLIAGATIGGFLAGFSAIYILAMVILIAILNFFVLPIGILITPEIIDPYFGLPILFLFNVIEVLAITDFVRGGA